ncbi:MAG: hydrogen gas-evolving membrane-bound hydrogenase subunit E [Tepidisphaerales bacterium]
MAGHPHHPDARADGSHATGGHVRPWLPPVPLGYLLAIVPLVGVALLGYLAAVHGTAYATPPLRWLPQTGTDIVFRFDALGLLFGFLVTGIGALVLAYAGHYMAHEPHPTRFLVTLLAFLLAMLGLVLADDLVAVFIFWELTSVTSFLLIGQTRTGQAKRGAVQALVVTGVGGLFLLAGIVLVAAVTGTTSLSALATHRELLLSHPAFLPILVLLALGCLTKSAQFPFHFWLPDSMAAPTPASAFLHSATMVKAGVYLLLRLHPTFGDTVAWSMLLVPLGTATLLLGAWQGLRQNDLKALLAYSTLAQLGALTLLLGIGTEKALAAVVIGILAHAAYKSALFLGVGIVDHAAGTRELSRLGGLARAMPLTLAVMAPAAVSFAGLPPTFGFVSKEYLLGAALKPTGDVGPAVPVAAYALAAAAVVSGALLFAQSARLVFGTFFGPRGPLGDDPHHPPHPHDPHPAMLLAVGLPALAGLVIPFLTPLDGFLNAAGNTTAVSVFFWHGINLPLVLSAVAVALGLVVFLNCGRCIAVQHLLDPGAVFRTAYTAVIAAVDAVARSVTRLQTGDLRTYLIVMTVATLAAALLLSPLRVTTTLDFFALSPPDDPYELSIWLLRAFTLLLTLGASVASVFLRTDFFAILALGASGIAMALLFALEPAPDVALVMLVVDILTVAVLVLFVARLPHKDRQLANQLDAASPRRFVHAAVCTAVAAGTAVLAYAMLSSRPRVSHVTPFFEANAKTLVGSTDIVGSIVIDFRGFDTFVEIIVFAVAGLGVYTLLRYAAYYAKDPALRPDAHPRPLPHAARGIGGPKPSPLIHGIGYLLLPLCLVLSAVHVMYGHDQPGDGFTAGVIASLGVAVHFAVFGAAESRRMLTWLRPTLFIGVGLLLVMAAMTLSGYLSGRNAFFAHFDFGAALGLAPYLPKGFALTSSLCFELAIGLTVLGAASHFIDTLGNPPPARTPEDQPAATRFSLEEDAPQPLDIEEHHTPVSPEDVHDPLEPARPATPQPEMVGDAR